MTDLTQSKILMIAAFGFEESELLDPRATLAGLGARIVVASPETKPIQGMKHHEKGATITPDIRLAEVDCSEYDALIIPGGVANPDILRMDADAVRIVRELVASGKPVAAICHGPWLLIEADVVRGRTVTSWPSLRTDLRNAGANVVDEEVVQDGNIITSRQPADIPAFTDAVCRAVTMSARPAQTTW